MAAAPIIATIVAMLLAYRTATAARRSNSVALVVWSFALLQFAAATAVLAWGVGVAWTPALYRAFYLFGAISNIAWLGLGTVWLLAPAKPAVVLTALLQVALAYAAVVVIEGALVPGAARALQGGSLPPPADVMPEDVRILSRWFSIGGSVVVLGGLAWSLVRGRGRALGLGLLFGGIAIVALAGELARARLVNGFSGALVAGIVLMYVGFVRSSTEPSTRR